MMMMMNLPLARTGGPTSRRRGIDEHCEGTQGMARTRPNRDEYSGGGSENSTTEPERWTRDRTRSSGRLVRVVEKQKASKRAIKIESSTDEEKEERSSNVSSVFDCNICFELAKEPVVTCCGHLFCWPCLYQWLHLHCNYKECPICKGKVGELGIIPIYGRGGSEDGVEKNKEIKSEEDGHQSSKIPIPPRPQGNRVESLRQQMQGSRLEGWIRTDAWFEELFNREVGRNPNPPVLPRTTPLSAPTIGPLSFLQDPSARLPDIFPDLRSVANINRRAQREFRYLDPARRRERDPNPTHSQASSSSTMAIIQGEVADASRSPSRGGSSPMVLRRRGRSRSSDSAYGNGSVRNRRRVN